jgi:hypothetical protein
MTFNEAVKKYPLLDMRVISKNGTFQILRCWFEGWHPELLELGRIKMIPDGLRGKETILTMEIIRPIQEVQVE